MWKRDHPLRNTSATSEKVLPEPGVVIALRTSSTAKMFCVPDDGNQDSYSGIETVNEEGNWQPFRAAWDYLAARLAHQNPTPAAIAAAAANAMAAAAPIATRNAKRNDTSIALRTTAR